MQRIIDGITFEGKYVPDAYDVSVWEHRGHREISARQVVEWSELGKFPDWSHLSEVDPVRDAADQAERKAKNLARAANRAKSQCRRLIKTMGFNTMLTNTYRENMVDESRIKRDMTAFHRRMGELVPGYGYVTGFEPQGRGAWHAHTSCYRLPKYIVFRRNVGGKYRDIKLESWRAVTVVWRSIVGKDNGMCYVGGKGEKAQKSCNSIARIAAYISKYITKHYELVPEGKNRYTHSRCSQIPKAERVRMVGLSLLDLIRKCFWLEPGERVIAHHVGRFKDGYYLCTELPGVPPTDLDMC